MTDDPDEPDPRARLVELLGADSTNYLGTGLTLREFMQLHDAEKSRRRGACRPPAERKRRRRAVVQLSIELGEICEATKFSTRLAELAIESRDRGRLEDGRGVGRALLLRRGRIGSARHARARVRQVPRAAPPGAAHAEGAADVTRTTGHTSHHCPACGAGLVAEPIGASFRCARCDWHLISLKAWRALPPFGQGYALYAQGAWPTSPSRARKSPRGGQRRVGHVPTGRAARDAGRAGR